MDRKEIVYRAIARRDPPRLPIHYCNRDFEFSDTLSVGMAPARGFQPSQPGMTEWGYVWHSLNDTMGQPEGRPLADPAALEGFVPPDPYAPGRFDDLDAASPRPRPLRQVRLGSPGTMWHLLRGFEDFLMDLHLEPSGRRGSWIWCSTTKRPHRPGVQHPNDAVDLWRRLGHPGGLMVRPALWRAAFSRATPSVRPHPRRGQKGVVPHLRQTWRHPGRPGEMAPTC
jgi:hypothetical protein